MKELISQENRALFFFVKLSKTTVIISLRQPSIMENFTSNGEMVNVQPSWNITKEDFWNRKSRAMLLQSSVLISACVFCYAVLHSIISY